MPKSVTSRNTERGIKVSIDDGATWLDLNQVQADLQLPTLEVGQYTLDTNTSESITESVPNRGQWSPMTFTLTYNPADTTHVLVVETQIQGFAGILVACQVTNGGIIGYQFAANISTSAIGDTSNSINEFAVTFTPCHTVDTAAVYPPVPTP